MCLGLEGIRLCKCRSPSANVQLDHPSLSRMHGMLGWHRQLGWVIADLGSVHGTYHNGNKLPAVSSHSLYQL